MTIDERNSYLLRGVKTYRNEARFEEMPQPFFYDGKTKKGMHGISVQIGRGCFFEIAVGLENLRKRNGKIYVAKHVLKKARYLAFSTRPREGGRPC